MNTGVNPSHYGLENHGIRNPGLVAWNLGPAALNRAWTLVNDERHAEPRCQRLAGLRHVQGKLALGVGAVDQGHLRSEPARAHAVEPLGPPPAARVDLLGLARVRARGDEVRVLRPGVADDNLGHVLTLPVGHCPSPCTCPSPCSCSSPCRC